MSRYRFDTVAGSKQISNLDDNTEQRDILNLSRGTAIILLFSESDLPLQPLLLEW